MRLHEINTPDWASGLNVVYHFDDIVIAVDDLEDATYASAYKKQINHNTGRVGLIKIGFLNTRGTQMIEGRKYLSIKNASIDQPFRGKGYGGYLYKALLAHTRYAGLVSYLPDQVNKRAVPAIYKRLGTRLVGDFGIIDKIK